MRLADNGWGWCAAVLMDDEHMRGRVTKGWMDGEIATRGKASTLAGTPIGAMTIVRCRSMWIVRIHGAVPRQSCPAIGREHPGTAGAPCRRASAMEQVGPRQPPRTSLWVCTSRIHREGRLVHPRNDGRPARRSRVNLPGCVKPTGRHGARARTQGPVCWQTKRPLQFPDACAVAGV